VTLAGLFESGHAVDIVLAVMLAEGVWLTARRRRSTLDVALALVPGALLLLALRAAVTQIGWEWVASFVALSFPVHLADLRRRGM